MTNNTIPNVPRELKPCPFCGDTLGLPSGDGTQYEIECGCGQAKASVQICDLMTLEERAADTFTDYRYGEEFVERAKVEAIERWNIRAPSPAGVDWLEVVGYVSQDDIKWQGDCTLRLKPYSDYVIPLCRLSDAHAIIDGLWGEVERLQRAEKNDAIAYKAALERQDELRTERDQHARRIGELEGLLLRVQVSLSLDDTEWGYSGAEKYKLLADIRAALSAVCAAAPNIAPTSEHSGS